MKASKNIIAVIPARGGSKQIKNKNLKKIKGISLVARTIKFAKSINLINEIVVSSDSEKILNESKKNGVDTFFVRPRKLSGDKISDFQVLHHSLKVSEKYFKKKFDYIVMLQPTSPLRKKKDIIKAIKKCIGKYDAVWTVSRVDKKFNPLKQFRAKGNKLSLINTKGKNVIARQQLENTYIRNGAVYVFTRNTIFKKKTIYPTNLGFIELNTKQISIDSFADLKFARSELGNDIW